MKPVSLCHFLDFLNAQTARDFQGVAVDDYLRTHRLTADAFEPFCKFREETYGRNLVYKSDTYELLVLTWMPKHRTPIHDHAGQRCWMVVQSGTLSFKTFEPIESGRSPLKVAGPVVTHSAGDAVYIDDGIGVHSIANASDATAVSIHLYAGPIPRCRIYCEATRSFDWVDLKYFSCPEEMSVTPTLSPEL